MPSSETEPGRARGANSTSSSAGRLEDLAGDRYDEYIRSYFKVIEPATRRMVTASRDVRLLAVSLNLAAPRLVCPPQNKSDEAPADLNPALKRSFEAFYEACDEWMDARFTEEERKDLTRDGGDLCPDVAPGTAKPILGEIHDELACARRTQANLAIEIAELERALAQAKKQHEQQPTTASADAVKDALENFDRVQGISQEVLDALRRLGLEELAVSVEVEKLTEQMAAVRALLDDVAKGGGEPVSADPAATRGAIAVARSLTALAAEIGDGLERPKSTSLLLESEHLRLQLAAARGRVAAAEARQGLLELKEKAATAELMLIRESLKNLDHYGGSGCPQNGALVDDFGRANAACKETLLNSLALYSNSWTTARVQEEEIDYRLIGERHGAALDVSEAALSQWNNLIGVPLAQLVAVHAGGIKPEEVAELVAALSAAGIAVGVNR